MELSTDEGYRGAALEQITARECEDVLRALAVLADEVPFGIKTTYAATGDMLAADPLCSYRPGGREDAMTA